MKILKSLIAIFLIFAVMALTACPKANKTLRTLRESSAKLSIYGTNIIHANIEAYKANEISANLFKDLTAFTGRYRDAVKIYRDSLDAAESIYKSTKNLPPGTIEKLSKLLDAVVSAFTDLTTKLNLVTGSQANTIKNIIASVQLTFLALQGAFSQANQFREVQSWAA